MLRFGYGSIYPIRSRLAIAPMFAATFFGLDLAPYRAYLPHIVGCGVATAIFAVVVGRKCWNATRQCLPESQGLGAVYPGTEDTFGNRRSSTRREGQPVLVHLASPAFHGATRDGWILDRSTGGLRIQIDTAVTPGTAIQVIAENAPDTTPWVTAIVRSCTPAKNHFELGCEFETTPPWNVLLLFG
jgi:hypothetical protein